jgi:two-component system, chemotaxis family, response regulator WspF
MRIGIVNDSSMATELLRRTVCTEEHQLAWIARDGAEAVTLCERDLPDLVLMDLIMPCMDGVEATRRIMSRTPCPILIVTATVAGNAAKVFEALSAGAVDAVHTPTAIASQKTGRALLLKIKSIERQTSGGSM